MSQTQQTATRTSSVKHNQAETIPYSEKARSFPNPTDNEKSHLLLQPPGFQAYTIPSESSESDLIWNDGFDWRGWRSKYTTIAALYVLAARHHRNTQQFTKSQTHHVLYSPPQDDITTPADVGRHRANIHTIADEIGLDGGMAVFHGYRPRQRAVDEFLSHVEETEYIQTSTDVLFWEWMRQADDWKHLVEWGPHFHLIGYTDSTLSNAAKGVTKQLRKFKSYNPFDKQVISEHRAVAKDCIDHVSFKQDNPSPPITWFGDLQGDSWCSAKQYTTDPTTNQIREALINGPSIPTKRYNPTTFA